MGFVIVGDHDCVRHGLCNDLLSEIFDGENNLKAQFLVLVSTIASDTHRQLDMHGSRRTRRGCCSTDDRRRLLSSVRPVFDLAGIEHDHPFLLILLECFLLIRFLLLLSRRSLPLPLNAA